MGDSQNGPGRSGEEKITLPLQGKLPPDKSSFIVYYPNLNTHTKEKAKYSLNPQFWGLLNVILKHSIS